MQQHREPVKPHVRHSNISWNMVLPIMLNIEKYYRIIKNVYFLKIGVIKSVDLFQQKLQFITKITLICT